jgi:hypothetical protein
MTKLHQLVAISKTVKSTSENVLTKAYQDLQKTPLLTGLARRYEPRDDDGERRAPEGNVVQLRSQQVIAEVNDAMVRLFDLVVTQDTANAEASADIIIEGVSLVANVPVTTLMWLDKKLVDLKTFISKLPVLDSKYRWSYTEEQDCYATLETEAISTKKLPRNHLKAPATEHHPAQVDVWMEDVPVGSWFTTNFSGALPQATVKSLLKKVATLQEAVKLAREQANSMTLTNRDDLGGALMGYLFGEVLSS